MERFILRTLVNCTLWSFAGDGKLKCRQDLGDYVRSITTIPLPPQENVPIIDFEVRRQKYPVVAMKAIVCIFEGYHQW